MNLFNFPPSWRGPTIALKQHVSSGSVCACVVFVPAWWWGRLPPCKHGPRGGGTGLGWNAGRCRRWNMIWMFTPKWVVLHCVPVPWRHRGSLRSGCDVSEKISMFIAPDSATANMAPPRWCFPAKLITVLPPIGSNPVLSGSTRWLLLANWVGVLANSFFLFLPNSNQYSRRWGVSPLKVALAD